MKRGQRNGSWYVSNGQMEVIATKNVDVTVGRESGAPQGYILPRTEQNFYNVSPDEPAVGTADAIYLQILLPFAFLGKRQCDVRG